MAKGKSGSITNRLKSSPSGEIPSGSQAGRGTRQLPRDGEASISTTPKQTHIMKLKIFNLKNVPTGRAAKSGGFYITLLRKGTVILSKQFAEQILCGRRVNFCQDEERTKDWYIQLTGNEGLEFKKLSNGQYQINSKAFVEMFLGSCEVDDNVASVWFHISSEAMEPGLHAILTKGPFNVRLIKEPATV